MFANAKRMNKTKKQWAMFLLGLTAILIGVSILGFFGLRKCYRLYQRQVLLENNPVVEIADLNIKAPILEGTDKRQGISRTAAILARAITALLGTAAHCTKNISTI